MNTSMTKWEYATVEYNVKMQKVSEIAYGPNSPLGIWNFDAKRNETFAKAKAKEINLLSVLDLLGADGWEMVGSVFDPKNGMGHFIFKRPASKKPKSATKGK